MIGWKRAIYRCGWGHRHVLVLPNPPAELLQNHGLKEGGLPKCPQLLRLVKTEEL